MEKIEKYIYEAIASSQHYYDNFNDNSKIVDVGVYLHDIVSYVTGRHSNITQTMIEETLNNSNYFKERIITITKDGKSVKSKSNSYMLSKPIYFKYRRQAPKSDKKWLFDIFKNSHLYAAKYIELNDVMEGFSWYSVNGYNQTILERIINEKQTINICSLCRNINNPIMWAHYADSFKGVSIGVEISDSNTVIPIKYTNIPVELAPYSKDTVQDILSKKLECWKYEREVRMFSDSKYIDTNIRIVFLGQRMSKYSKGKMKRFLNKIDSDIIVVDDFRCDVSLSSNKF